MNKQDYIKELETSIIGDMVKDVNLMLSNPKVGFLSTSLMLKLKPVFVVIEDPYATLPKAVTLEDLDTIFKAYIPYEDPTTVIFELHYDNKKTLKRALKLAKKHSSYFSFHYIKNLHATIGQVHTTAYTQSLMKAVKDKENPFIIATTAIDRKMTTYALETLKASGIPLNDLQSVVEGMSAATIEEELDIIAKNIASQSITKIPSYIRKIRIKPIMNIKDIIEVIAYHTQGVGQFGYTKGAAREAVVVDLSQSINHSIASSCKGTNVGNLFAVSFRSNPIDALWFEDLQKSLISQILEKSHEGYSSWENISKTKRHIYPSPIRISTEHKLNLYVTIDHSGSVSTGDLQKILSVFETYSHLIESAVVMHHTAAVIQQYKLNSSYGDLIDHPEFEAAFATRSGSGGTSHGDCVKRIVKDIEENSIDPAQVIWLSFSDGYSDLEDVCMKEFRIMDKLEKFFIRDSRGRDIKLNCIPGKNHNIVTP